MWSDATQPFSGLFSLPRLILQRPHNSVLLSYSFHWNTLNYTGAFGTESLFPGMSVNSYQYKLFRLWWWFEISCRCTSLNVLRWVCGQWLRELDGWQAHTLAGALTTVRCYPRRLPLPSAPPQTQWRTTATSNTGKDTIPTFEGLCKF